jgi:hypothetical protein
MTTESLKKKYGILCKLSILLFISGFVLFVSAFYLMNQTDVKDSGDLGTLKSVGITVLLFAAFLTCAKSCVGCLAAKCKNKCIIVLFGCSLGSTATAIFVLGTVFASTANWLPQTVELACTPK